MKYLKSFTIFIIIILGSCKKESATPGIVGQWKWIYYQGDSPSNYRTPQNTGIQQTAFLC